jgi:selenide,water dikinase
MDETALAPAVAHMTTLNKRAAAAMVAHHAHAATDITGYGLLGHAREMALASGVSLTIHAAAVPAYDGVLALIAGDCVPGGSRDNAAHHAGFTAFADSVAPELRLLLSDATTSGGLLIAAAPHDARAIAHDLGATVAFVGHVGSGEPGTIAVQ